MNESNGCSFILLLVTVTISITPLNCWLGQDFLCLLKSKLCNVKLNVCCCYCVCVDDHQGPTQKTLIMLEWRWERVVLLDWGPRRSRRIYVESNVSIWAELADCPLIFALHYVPFIINWNLEVPKSQEGANSKSDSTDSISLESPRTWLAVAHFTTAFMYSPISNPCFTLYIWLLS